MANQIWLDGVLLENVYSGDVSAIEDQLRAIIGTGGGWFMTPFEYGHYTIHVGPNASVIASYSN